jgi:hypothetical protein
MEREAQKADDLSQAVNAINLDTEDADEDDFKLPPPPLPAKSTNSETYETESSDDSDLELISAPPVARPIPSSSSTSTTLGKRPQPPSPGPKAAKARPAKQKPVMSSGAWTCDICTFSNPKAMALACEVCGSERSSANGNASLADFEDEPPAPRGVDKPLKKNVQTQDGW